MKKVVLACFCVKETNVGDKSYVDTIRAILAGYSDEITVDLCDFYARVPNQMTQNGAVPPPSPAAKTPSPQADEKKSALRCIKDLMGHLVPSPIIRYRISKQKEKAKLMRYARIKAYYEEHLEGASALIIPGGGLVEFSSWRDYYYLLEMLEDVCAKKGIDIYINSVGYVANEEPKSWIKRWEKVVNHPNVRFFCCRDNLPFFLRIKKDAKQIPCLACLGADYLGVKKKENTNTVGIGLMRFDAFSDYGNDITKEFLLDYYKNLIDKLIERGYKVRLFSVGVIRDHTFGEEILERVANPDVILEERPEETKTLLEQISAYSGIITVRTHSAYAAFSLDVPAIMIYFGVRGWAGKSTEFMKMMGRPENAVCCDNLSGEQLVDVFESAVSKGWNEEVRSSAKKMARDNITNVIDEIRSRPE